jgi:hypothetical protein
MGSAVALRLARGRVQRGGCARCESSTDYETVHRTRILIFILCIAIGLCETLVKRIHSSLDSIIQFISRFKSIGQAETHHTACAMPMAMHQREHHRIAAENVSPCGGRAERSTTSSIAPCPKAAAATAEGSASPGLSFVSCLWCSLSLCGCVPVAASLRQTLAQSMGARNKCQPARSVLTT